ncbi:MAG: signal peptidase II [Mesorhizobium sp.]|uniref:signal peptidase II n=1 Tax=Mesorhizobium sp. TaxID=1871066 RepID=UPI00121FD4A6|nr:signal peptidase II [Mesorhizobium sp.]TIM96512.1 MAG: signal peptidase II [Mesorhizobium sp.]
MRSWSPYALLVVAAIALDQWIKHLVETGLPFQEKLDLVPFLALFRTYNTGIAFSMFSSFGDTGLIAISLAVVAFVLFLATRIAPSQILARTGFALIVGGALGNLIDRAIYGHVIDYILFHTPVWSFAVFNLADAFISVGAALVVFDELFGWRREPGPSDANSSKAKPSKD